MTETTAIDTQKTPGMVIFVSVLNFITAGFAFLGMLISMVILIFGNVLGAADYVARQVSQMEAQANLSYGVNFIFISVFLAALLVFALFMAIGIGLLKGKKFAWFVQVAFSILGLLGFPFYTILNGVILFFFFRPRVRDYFKV